MQVSRGSDGGRDKPGNRHIPGSRSGGARDCHDSGGRFARDRVGVHDYTGGQIDLHVDAGDDVRCPGCAYLEQTAGWDGDRRYDDTIVESADIAAWDSVA